MLKPTAASDGYELSNNGKRQRVLFTRMDCIRLAAFVDSEDRLFRLGLSSCKVEVEKKCGSKMRRNVRDVSRWLMAELELEEGE